MFYFKTTKYLCNCSTVEAAERTFLQRTSKSTSLIFEVETTTAYMIDKQRIFTGKRLKKGGALLSRKRHMTSGLLPRIIIKWQIENKDNQLWLVCETKLAFFSSIFFLGSVVGITIAFIKLLMNSQINSLLGPLIFMAIFFAGFYYEFKVTHKMIRQLLDGKEVKSMFYV